MPESGVRLTDKSYHTLLPGESIRPLRDRIVLKPLDCKLSETILAVFSGETVRGEIVAIGPGKYPNRHYRGKKDGKEWRHIKPSQVFRPTELKVGDIVSLGGMELGGYMFPTVYMNGAKHILCEEADVAVVES